MIPLLKKQESFKRMFKPIMSNLLNKTIIIDLNEVSILSILKLNFIAQNNNN